MWRSFDNFIKGASLHLMKLLGNKFGENLVDLAHATSQLGVEVVFDEVVSPR